MKTTTSRRVVVLGGLLAATLGAGCFGGGRGYSNSPYGYNGSFYTSRPYYGGYGNPIRTTAATTTRIRFRKALETQIHTARDCSMEYEPTCLEVVAMSARATSMSQSQSPSLGIRRELSANIRASIVTRIPGTTEKDCPWSIPRSASKDSFIP